jgi:hypothetical protein
VEAVTMPFSAVVSSLRNLREPIATRYMNINAM